MSQDVVADALNQIMNAKRIGKTSLEISKYSKLLINLFSLMQEKEHIEFKVDENEKKIVIKILKLNECRAVKPRYHVRIEEIDKYLRRYLPSRNFGSLIISTSQGLVDHNQAYENNTGGSVVAYFY